MKPILIQKPNIHLQKDNNAYISKHFYNLRLFGKMEVKLMYEASLLESVNDAVISTDKKGNIIYWNKASEDLFGWKKGEILGRFIGFIFVKEFEKLGYEVRDEVIKKDKWTGGLNYIKKDRTIFNSSTSVSKVKNEDGEFIGFVGVINDITNREDMEKELKLSYEYLDNIILNLPVGIAILEGPEFRYFKINKVLADMNGLSIEAHLGKTVAEVLPEATEEIVSNLNNVRKSGKAILDREFSICLPKNPKEIRHLIDFHFPIKINGKIKAIGAVVIDITERKKAEEELESQKNLYSTLVETIPHVIWTGNSKGEVTFLNKAWKDWTGREIKDSLGHKWAESVHPDDSKKLLAKWERAYKYGKPYNGECRFKTKDGSYITTSFVGVPVRDSSSKITNWIGIDVDITNLKEFEEQIKVSLREKEEFLKEIHHRIKNNLQIISSLLNLQSSKIEDNKLKSILEDSQSRIRAMSLIHEKLYQSTDLEKISSESYIKSLVNEIYNSYKSDSLPIKIEMNVNDFPLDAKNAIPLGLIINELITNSMKYAFEKNEHNKINVKIILNDNIKLIVSDNGVGLKKDVDPLNSKSLGLQLVNILTKQLDGQIEFFSNNGLKCEITIPVEKLLNK